MAGAASFLPTSTGVAIAALKALPEFEGRFDGLVVRALVTVGAIADIVFVVEREKTVEAANQIFREAAESSRHKRVVGVTEDPTWTWP